MAQSILDVPVAGLRLQVRRIPTDQVKALIRGIYELKWTVRDRITDPQILDLERKETILQKELQRRGYLGDGEKADFAKWKRSLFARRFR